MFLDAFQSSSAYSLRLEDLTRGDIRRFVSDLFEAYDQYQQLRSHNAEYENLTEKVVARAQGVFLWVFLVVRELLEGLTYNDSMQMMQQRLDQSPADLEEFFQYMIESIPPVYRRQAARTFFITVTAQYPLPLTLHAFLDDMETDPDFFLNKTKLLDEAELLRMHERMRRQLEGRTKGLLEVVPDSNGIPYYRFHVDFLHRTVRDFLQSSSEVQPFMTSGGTDVSEAWVLLCRGMVSVIRHGPISRDRHATTPFVDQEEDLARCFFYLSRFVEKALQFANNGQALAALFRAAESTERNIPQTWNRLHHPRLQEVAIRQGALGLLRHSDFGLVKFDPYFWTPQKFVPPLRSACVYFSGAFPKQQPGIVTYLLEHGANPNEIWNKLSHFQLCIKCLVEEKVSGEQQYLAFQIVAALVAHGADVRGKFDGVSTLDLVRQIFPPELVS